MSRWHAASCAVPQVCVGQDSVPYCKTCSASAYECLESLKQTTLGCCSLPPIPPDKPMGQLNLSWPPTVPWTRELEVHETAMHEAAELKAAPPEATSNNLGSATTETQKPKKPLNSSDQSHIYKPLEHGHFRLICLEPSGEDKVSAVVHLELETHRFEQCPEYETVSYSWGGEDGNSSLCQPIYIGDFWDVLLQTQNCFSMLQYLRPQRGCRIVWVDAICINQEDIIERTDQVQRMREIYSQCIQVVLWLGADIVRPIPGTYPSRRPLRGLVMDARPNNPREQGSLRSLLERRYFTRVWIVQELILAPRVIMPVGNTIVFADPRTSREFQIDLPPHWNWEETHVPWMQHITQGVVEVNGLFDVACLLVTSHASDARDHVFGIIGLLPYSPKLATLQPNYSLSLGEVFIGFIAHSIFVEEKYFLLHKACGVTSTIGIPSWVPDYTKTAVWNHILSEAYARVPDWTRVESEVANSGFEVTLEKPFITSQALHSTADTNFYLTSVKTLTHHTRDILSDAESELTPRVHHDNGSLSINLRRVLLIRGAPVPAGLQTMQGCRVPIMVPCNSGSLLNPHVYLVGSGPLHTIIKEGDEIWVLESHNSPAVFLVLRSTDKCQSFGLVATFHYLFLVYRTLLPDPNIPTWPRVMRSSTYQMEEHMVNVYTWVRRSSSLRAHNLEFAFPAKTWYSNQSIIAIKDIFETTFLGVSNIYSSALLPFVMRAFEEDGSETPCLPKRWEDLYISSLNSEMQPRIDGGYCYVNAYENHNTKPVRNTWNVISIGHGIILRRRLDEIKQDLVGIISSCQFYLYLETCLSLRQRIYKDYAHSDIEILTSEPGDSRGADQGNNRGWAGRLRDRGFFDHKFSIGVGRPAFFPYNELCRDFGLDGSHYRVTIV